MAVRKSLRPNKHDDAIKRDRRARIIICATQYARMRAAEVVKLFLVFYYVAIKTMRSARKRRQALLERIISNARRERLKRRIRILQAVEEVERRMKERRSRHQLRRRRLVRIKRIKESYTNKCRD